MFKSQLDLPVMTSDAADDEGLIQRMTRYRVASVHDGCVNSICWNDRGTNILSGSDDQHLKITDPFPYEPKVRHNWFLISN